MLALDLDGTLLNTREEISARNLRAVREAVNRGIKVVIVTGRSNPSAHLYLGQLNLPYPHVTYNGAVIHDGTAVMLSNLLEHDTIERTVLALREFDHVPILYDLEDHRYYQDLGPYRDQFLELSRGMELNLHQVEDLLQQTWSGIVRMSVFMNEEQALHLEKHLPAHLGESLRTVQTHFPGGDFWIFEILDSRSSKSGALSHLCRGYGIEPGEVIAVGDNQNDIDMIEWAGLGVAMANSKEPVRARADIVTERTNDEHGVEEVIERYLL
jgi:hypothetical protein